MTLSVGTGPKDAVEHALDEARILVVGRRPVLRVG
jgi:hypothetical protein